MSTAPALWVISGLSGAGKATVLTALERAGVECVDNLAVDLLEQCSRLARRRPTAAVVDARQHEALARFESPPGVRVLFLDARDDVLVRRISESTRPHPCGELGRGRDAVSAERTLLAPLRSAADLVIDTSELSPAELGARVAAIVAPDHGSAGSPVSVTLSSFGFKFGLPLDADWVIDARMIRNPFWEAELRPHTGLDGAVHDYVLSDPVARELVDRLHALVAWSSERYAEHGRRFLHVAIGCTGGRHRSVVLTETLAGLLREDGGSTTVRHRDVEKDDPR